MTAVSQWEREAIGERTRDAMNHKRSQGQRVGNIPYGSRLAEDRVHLEDDPAEQVVLAEIHQLRRDGSSLRGIAAALNHRTYRTRRGTGWRVGVGGTNPETRRTKGGPLAELTKRAPFPLPG